jgi:2-methylcitrate dehydratase PrpD
MSEQQDYVTRAMADFAFGTTWDALPEQVRRESVRAWMNWVGCTLGGSGTAAMDRATQASAVMGSGQVPLLGRCERVGLADAALLNCLASCAHTFDDTHLATITHPTGPVAAAALAAAHQQAALGRPVSGAKLLAALAIGIELECRVSCAITAGGANFGWYMTGLSGGIGAAAAVGRLLELDRAQIADAIGLAAAQSSGIRATHGSMAITYVPGIAARNGLQAAYLAAAGFGCSPGAIDGRNGLLQVLTGKTDAQAVRDGLGSRFESLNNTYKPFPCGIVIHPALDACLWLARQPGWSAAQVERVELRVHPDALTLTWRKLPPTALEAQVSLYHWVAAALVEGAAGIEQGTERCVQDPAVRALQERSFATADPALGTNQAAVKVTLRDGTVLEHFTHDVIGSVTNPMSDEALAMKFRVQAEPVLGAARAAELFDLCLATPTLADAADVLALGATQEKETA